MRQCAGTVVYVAPQAKHAGRNASCTGEPMGRGQEIRTRLWCLGVFKEFACVLVCGPC